MAKFNPATGLSATNVPSGLGFSQGIGTNQTFKTLFEGVGNAVAGAAQGQDQLNQQNIYKDAQNATNQVQSVFGVDAAENSANGPATAVGINKGSDQMTTLVKAYQSGTISDTYYYTKLNDIVKGLRSKYPGYDQQIDNTIQNITGVTPANAIVSSIRSNALAGASTSQNQWYTYQKDNEGIISSIHPDWQGVGDTRYSQQQIYADVAHYKATEAQIDLQGKKNALATSTGTLDHKDVVAQAQLVARTRGTQAISGGLSSVGTNFAAADKTFKGLADGSIKLQDADVATLGIQINAAKAQLTNGVVSELQKPLDPNNPASPSVWDQLTEAERTDVKNNATAQLDAFSTAIANQDFGMVRALSLSLEVEKNGALAELYKKYPVTQQLQSLSTILGPNFGAFIQNQIEKSPDLAQAMIGIINQSLALSPPQGGGNSPPPVKGAADVISDVKNDPKGQTYSSATVTDFTRNMTKVIIDPKSSPDAVKAATVSLFHDQKGFDLSAFKDDEAHLIYGKLVNPAVTAQIKAMNDPQTWNTYAQWAYKNFDNVFGIQLKDLKDLGISSQLVGVQFNPKTNLFDVTKNDLSQYAEVSSSAPPGTQPLVNPGYYALQDKAYDAFQNINTALSGLAGVVKANGEDVPTHMLPYLQSIGLPAVDGVPSPNSNVAGKGDRLDTHSSHSTQSPSTTSTNPDPVSNLGVTDISKESTYNRGKLNDVQGIVFHHTSDNHGPNQTVQDLNSQGYGVQYVISRDGKIYQTLPEGARGAHILNATNGTGLNNSNTVGIEVEAKDNADVTPAQVQAGVNLAHALEDKYGLSSSNVWGHGELNPGHREADEGQAIVSAVRGGAQPVQSKTQIASGMDGAANTNFKPGEIQGAVKGRTINIPGAVRGGANFPGSQLGTPANDNNLLRLTDYVDTLKDPRLSELIRQAFGKGANKA